MIAIDWKPSTLSLRKFGRSMLIFGLIFAAWFWLRKAPAAAWTFAGLGVYCFLTSQVVPAAARPVYVLWMGIAWLLGMIITPVIMGALYYLVITPIGLVLRLTGHDRLRLKKPAGTSYWVDCKASPSYERQF
ncbi:MAG: SxtJ family membrane protein [Prosthecobacter sp.]